MGLDVSDKSSEFALATFLSSPSLESCEKLIGKTVGRVEAREYSFKIIFTDLSFVECSGNTYDGCALDVEIT
jgi:hypothetical protein